jgi:PhzF family phenazine biosynthesis protein
MHSIDIFQVNSFTQKAFAGNPAGVVRNARGLTDEMMQLIAREMNLSETAFVFPSGDCDGDVTVRFFTPSTEVPICGHATIAAHFVLARTGKGPGVCTQHTGAGPLKVETAEKDGACQIWMHQKTAEFSPAFDTVISERIVAALGIESSELLEGYPLQIVSTGHSKVVIPVRDRASIVRMQPDNKELIEISKAIGCNGFYPWTFDSPDAGCLTHGRMFAPAIGIAEDPVTGNASGCLGAYLIRHGLLPVDSDGLASFYAGQGHELNRPGRVLVGGRLSHRNDSISIKIAGEAVIVIEGQLVLPE